MDGCLGKPVINSHSKSENIHTKETTLTDITEEIANPVQPVSQQPQSLRQQSASGRSVVTPPGRVLTARYDYDARTNEDLAFKKGDQMVLIDDTDGDWWLARHCRTELEGYVPRNYVALEDSLERYDDGDWWLARHCRTELEGYVPRNYVALEDSLERYEFSADYFNRELGYFITKVNNVTANFALDKSFWAFLSAPNTFLDKGVSNFYPHAGDHIIFNLTTGSHS